MDHDSRRQLHNDHHLASQSTVQINFSYQSQHQEEEDDMPTSILERSEDPNHVPLWLLPGPWLQHNDIVTPSIIPGTDELSEELERLFHHHQRNVIYAGVETEEPLDDPLAHLPTFSFEQPPELDQSSQPSRSCSLMTQVPQRDAETEDLLPSQGSRAIPHRPRKRSEYDKPTMRDFRRHCGVIDFGQHVRTSAMLKHSRNQSAVSVPWTSSYDYQHQLEALERQNNGRQRLRG
ncbi:hypothetical protein PV10_03947 [Exophiala mesophila]|uniref:Uncharacterized protein n=1 Tax=Exophiala mesophila TaxID=212818 RepID=A0A0D1ZFL9_EXOME|nr:uncharacterized protein PV10_03947 [Exophiala mesophila]KIV92674.1 hypothetical protein PV10_03947 [Exophiala mesophila]